MEVMKIEKPKASSRRNTKEVEKPKELQQNRRNRPNPIDLSPKIRARNLAFGIVSEREIVDQCIAQIGEPLSCLMDDDVNHFIYMVSIREQYQHLDMIVTTSIQIPKIYENFDELRIRMIYKFYSRHQVMKLYIGLQYITFAMCVLFLYMTVCTVHRPSEKFEHAFVSFSIIESNQ